MQSFHFVSFTALVCLLHIIYSSRLNTIIWGCIAATIFEYLTAQVMLRLFDEVWWDYTHKKINYKGILCLQSTLGWGFLALFIFGFFNRLVENLVFALDERFVCFFGAVLTISYLIDFTIHFIQNIQNSESFKNMDILSRIIRH